MYTSINLRLTLIWHVKLLEFSQLKILYSTSMQYKLARRAKLIEKIGSSLFATIESRLMEVFKLK